ncbi:MAG: ABC transporter ATP-binding protein [Eggerthellaceae bacterium]
MIEVHDIEFRYKEDRAILQEVSARVRAGEFMAILGNNGVGKSTFLYCLNRILKPKSGVVIVGGEEEGAERRNIYELKRNELAREIALVAQHSHAGQLTVFDSVLLGRKPYINMAPTEHDLAIVQNVLERLKLAGLALRYVDELSGGEYQKVVLARALAQQTDVLLLDEPTNNLDPANQLEVMRNVREVVDADRIAAVAVMHDLNLSVRYCDTFVFMKEGRVYAHGGPEIVDARTIFEVYGMDADVLDHKGRKVIVPK